MKVTNLPRVLLAIGALAVTFVPFAGAASTSRTITLHLVEKDLSFAFQDAAPQGIASNRVSPGDAIEFSAALLTRGGNRAGTLRAHCVYVTGGTEASAASVCTGTFGFKGGSLEAQTMQRGDSRVTRIAIVGGTGVYEGATGSVDSVSAGNGPSRDTFHIVLP